MPPELQIKNVTGVSRFLNIFVRRYSLIIIFLIIFLGIGSLLTLSQQVKFESTALVLVDQVSSPLDMAESQNISNEIAYAYGDQVKESIKNFTNRNINIEIRNGVDNESTILEFRAISETAKLSAEDANLWAQTYIEVKREQESSKLEESINLLQTEQDALKSSRIEKLNSINSSDIENTELKIIDTQLTNLSANLSNLRIYKLTKPETAEIIQLAIPPEAQIPNSLIQNLILSAILGALVGASIAYLTDRFDDKIYTTSDLSEMRAPVLGVIPGPENMLNLSDLPLASMSQPNSEIAKHYQAMRIKITRLKSIENFSSILVASPNRNEGCTSTAVNLAWALGSANNKIVLADTNFREPSIHKVFGCSIEPGITNHIFDHDPLKQVALKIANQDNDVIVLPSGYIPKDPNSLLPSKSFSNFIKNLSRQADLTILDSPPASSYSDTAILASNVDRVILVIKSGSTKKEELKSTINTLKLTGANILGICVTSANWKDWSQDQITPTYALNLENTKRMSHEPASEKILNS